MTFFNMFRTPYLDGDDGVNLGGGGTPTDTAGQQTDTQTADTTLQDGQQQTQIQQPQIPQAIKVKFNHEEREIPYEEAVAHIQKGMNYEKAVERARQEALQGNSTLSYLTQKAQRLGMSVEQLIENDRQYEEQQEIQRYAQKEQISYETAERLFKLEQKMSAKEKEEQESSKQKAEQAAEQKMYSDFLDAYPEFNDPAKAKEIPADVWKEVKAGRNLTDAYVRYENKMLKAEREKFQTQQQTQQANQANAAASTGSVKDGGKDGDFISSDEFEANRHDQSWVMKNYSKIQKSRAKW